MSSITEAGATSGTVRPGITGRHVNCQIVQLTDLDNRDFEAWRQLSDEAVEPNPFFDPDLVLPAASALGERHEVGLLVAKTGADWIGCMPVRRHRHLHRVPLPSVATWRHLYCFLGTPLLMPDTEPEALRAMITSLGELKGNAFSTFEWVAAEGRVGEAFAAVLPPKTLVLEDFQRAALKRRPDADYLDGWVKGKDRREVRRRARLLGKELGGSLELVDRCEAGGAIDEFLAIEASGWKGEAETALASNPTHADFFREVVRRFADRRAVNLSFLEAGGTSVAATCNLLAGGVDFCFKLAYDERFRRFAPGRDLTFKMIEHFHDDDELRMMDSCTSSDNDLCNQVWRDRRRIKSFAIATPGLRGRLALPALRALREARRSKARKESSTGS